MQKRLSWRLQGLNSDSSHSAANRLSGWFRLGAEGMGAYGSVYDPGTAPGSRGEGSCHQKELKAILRQVLQARTGAGLGFGGGV